MRGVLLLWEIAASTDAAYLKSFQISAGFLYASYGEAPVNTANPAHQVPAETTQSAADEASGEAGDALSPAQIALNAMTEEYKTLKELQYEGEEESSLYPKTMDLYLTAVKALELAEDEEQRSQVKNIILDINGQLLKGAFY